MADAGRRRVLIVVFDALRPEFVTPDLMPNLAGFAARGVRYLNSRSTFPTETRVNQSAVVTGCTPARHGIVANRFVETDGAVARVLNTGNDLELEAAFKRLGPRLIQMPTLGERLAGAGRTYASISAGTPGGGRLINHAAEANGSFRLALRRPEAAVPARLMWTIGDRFGPAPEHALPALAWNSYAVTCYLDYVEPEVRPDVMLLWLSEPDESFHRLGIGSHETRRAMRHMDGEFGRILDRQQGQIDAGILQIVALSDHGQISLRGKPLDLAGRLSEAGFNAVSRASEAADCLVVVGNAGGVWVRDSASGIVGELTEWLRRQDWCGPLFTRDGAAGALTHRDVGLAHARSPDIALVLRYDDADNGCGSKGMSLHDSHYREGGGCHGGLSPYELHNFLAMAGGVFAEGRAVTAPAGNPDILPTVLTLLGLEAPKDIDGRVLREAFRDSGAEDAGPARETVLSSSNADGPVTHLSVTALGTSRYLNRAWVE